MAPILQFLAAMFSQRFAKFSLALRLTLLASLSLAVFASATESCQRPVATPSRSEKMALIARSAKLRYITEESPGYSREVIENSKGEILRIVYRDSSNGKVIKNEKLIERLSSLRLPPGYKDVWFSKDPSSHLQATGIDEAGRKQYRYHPRWLEVAAVAKFHRSHDFGKALPKIRAASKSDASKPGLGKLKVLASIVRILEKTLIRIGNEEYAVENAHFGLTTLRDRHVKIRGSRVQFSFMGKSHKQHTITFEDPALASLLGNLRKLPGQNLFQYVDSQGRHEVDSDMVNDYIKDISGGLFTAKDYRTWFATKLAAEYLYERRASAGADRETQIDDAMEFVSERLGNTKAVCRESYVDPRVIEAFEDGKSLAAAFDQAKKKPRAGLSRSEVAVLILQENF